MRLFVSLTGASLKMYFRNRQAIFWSLFFPLLIMVIFGLLDFDRFNPPDVGLVDRAGNQASASFLAGLKRADDKGVIKLTEGGDADLLKKLDDGDLNAVVEVPAGFGGAGSLSQVTVKYDSDHPQEYGVTLNVVNDVLNGVFREVARVPSEYQFEERFQVNPEPVAGQGQGYSGFLVPGVVAMSIMQLGIFGVAFTLVRYRAQGVLRRLKATPIDPAQFLAGQVITRLIIAVAQAVLLFAIGAVVLDVTIGRNNPAAWLLLLVLSILGGTLFISLGLAVSGFAKNEDTAAPITNIIAMPMMFLSGVFFPVTSLPGFIESAARFLPLTFLANGIRSVAVEGGGIADIRGDLLGLLAWCAIAFAISARTFRWE